MNFHEAAQALKAKAQAELKADDILAEIARLRAENAALKAAKVKGKPISLRLSEKGGLSVYGLGRFPVTLYKSQWQKLLSVTGEIEAFLADHAEELSTKE